MYSIHLLRQHRLPAVLTIVCTLLGDVAAAQNAPTPVAAPTGDKVLYGRHAARHSNQPMPQNGAQAQGLTRRQRKVARRQYQGQHRAAFPNVNQPGVE